ARASGGTSAGACYRERPMNDPGDPTKPALPGGEPLASNDEVRRCVEILEGFVADRTRLVHVPAELRVALLQAAGRISRPVRHEKQRASKAFRRVDRAHTKEADRAVRAGTEIRAARRAAVFTAPPQLVAPPVAAPT